MELREYGRCALSSGAAAVLLASCSGGANGGVEPLARGVAGALPHHHTFFYVNKKQTFKVPAGVTSVHVVALGAAGGGGARAGRVFALIPVTPGETLYVFVGGAGVARTGGFNGGASGGDQGRLSGYGGGGATDLREGGEKLGNRIIVAGGAGGAGGLGYYSGGVGGRGGGTIGGSGSVGGNGSRYYGGGGGTGGTQSAGGSGGSSGTGSFGYGDPGSAGLLGAGGAGGAGNYAGGGGGGGGGGYYGGGGGGAGGLGESEIGGGGGGGGGSSFVESSATRYRMWQGWKTATRGGLIVISW